MANELAQIDRDADQFTRFAQTQLDAVIVELSTLKAEGFWNANGIESGTRRSLEAAGRYSRALLQSAQLRVICAALEFKCDVSPVLIDVSDPEVLAAWTAAMEAHATQVKARDYVEMQLTRARVNGLRGGAGCLALAEPAGHTRR